MIKNLLILIIFFLSFSFKVFGIDPGFSQYYLNPLHSNPAVAGSANDPRLFLHYRNQWPALGNTLLTYQASYDQHVKAINGGIGFNVLSDDLGGIISNTNIDLIYSYRFKVTQHLTMQAGLSTSFLFQGINVTKYSNNKDEVVGELPISGTNTQPDFGLGFMGMNRNSQFGISVSHLNSGYLRFNSDFSPSPVKFNAFYAYTLKIFDKTKVKDNGFYITPAFLVQMQGGVFSASYGAGVQVESVFAGLWARSNFPGSISSTIFSVGYAFDNITLGYSYDYNMLSLNKIMPNTGAHEVTLIAVFPLDPKRGRYRAVKSPVDLKGLPVK